MRCVPCTTQTACGQRSGHYKTAQTALLTAEAVSDLQVLSRAMRASADSLQGWQLLCQLQLQNEQYDLAAESATMGLKCLHQRRSRGYRSHPAVAAAMVLTRGYSLLARDHPDEALVLFKALTGILSHAMVVSQTYRLLTSVTLSN